MTVRTQPILSTDDKERKKTPLFSALRFFPLAFAALARHIQRSNDKHNPGEPIHWAREKSTEHAECCARHLLEIDLFNEKLGEYEDAVASLWRAAAIVQLLEEKRLGREPVPGPETVQLVPPTPGRPAGQLSARVGPDHTCNLCGKSWKEHDAHGYNGKMLCPPR